MLNICILISTSLIGLAQSGPLKRYENATSSLPTGYGSSSSHSPSTRPLIYGTPAASSLNQLGSTTNGNSLGIESSSYTSTNPITSGRVTTLTMYTTIPPGAGASLSSGHSPPFAATSSSPATLSHVSLSTTSTLSRSFVYSPLTTSSTPSNRSISTSTAYSSTQQQSYSMLDGASSSSVAGISSPSSTSSPASATASTFSSRTDASSSSLSFLYPYPASSSPSASKAMASSSSSLSASSSLHSAMTSALAYTPASDSSPPTYQSQTSGAVQSTSSGQAQSDQASSQTLPFVIGSTSSTLGATTTSIPGITIQPIPASQIYTMTVTVTVTDPGKTTTVAEKTVTVKA